MKGRNIRRVVTDLYEIRDLVAAGGYGREEHAVLARSLLWTRKNLNLKMSELSACVEVSQKIVSNIVGGGTPKLDNFLRCTNNLIIFLEEWIEHHPEVPPVVSGPPADWRYLKAKATNKVQKISEQITGLLDIVRYSNSLAMNDKVLPPELKAQLIALLEATLAQLRSPMVEKSFISRVGRWLVRIGTKVGVEVGEGTLESLAGDAGRGLLDLLKDTVI